MREQAFTVLNRLCALRMAEARGLLIESMAKGYQSKGFQLYARLAGTRWARRATPTAATCSACSTSWPWICPSFSTASAPGAPVPARGGAPGSARPAQPPRLEPLWAEDETIGWIYQYFNRAEERKKMREESAAPRNSRELAVRNQFFTPRYVVEFLTDNTLGGSGTR